MTSEPSVTCSWMRSSLALRCSASRSRCVLAGIANGRRSALRRLRGRVAAREALGILGVEVVVRHAAVVQLRARFMQIGLRALTLGLLLGVLGAQLALIGLRAVPVGHLAAAV